MKKLLSEKGVSPQLAEAAEELLELDKKSDILSKLDQFLGWDSRTHMPKAATESRAEQLALIGKLMHSYNTKPRIAELLHTLGVDDENTTGDATLPRPIRLWLRQKYAQWKKAVSVPPALVTEIAHATTLGHEAWAHARERKDISIFAPHLQKLISLSKNYAMCIGYEKTPYDALLDDYEMGCTTEHVNEIFGSLQKELQPLYTRLVESHKRKKPPCEIPRVDAHAQKNFCHHMAQKLGYDFSWGRIDTSIHPFCATAGWQDLRITTHYKEHDAKNAVFSTLHEMGHAFYEKHISPLYKNTICSTGASYGVHESQSLFVEHMIGKNLFFWKHWYPELQQFMPQFADISLDAFMAHIRCVKQNPIRIESDEVGYNLHIILRFEIEKLLFENENTTEHDIKDIAHMWNEKSKTLLGIEPKDDCEGILQDVHWAEGAFGYFPSYALGTVYASQLAQEIEKDMPNYETHLECGTIEPILSWLKTRIHMHGASQTPAELYPTYNVHTLITHLEKRYTA